MRSPLLAWSRAGLFVGSGVRSVVRHHHRQSAAIAAIPGLVSTAAASRLASRSPTSFNQRSTSRLFGGSASSSNATHATSITACASVAHHTGAGASPSGCSSAASAGRASRSGSLKLGRTYPSAPRHGALADPDLDAVGERVGDEAVAMGVIVHLLELRRVDREAVGPRDALGCRSARTVVSDQPKLSSISAAPDITATAAHRRRLSIYVPTFEILRTRAGSLVRLSSPRRCRAM